MASNYLDDWFAKYSGGGEGGSQPAAATSPAATKIQSQIARIDEVAAKRKAGLKDSAVQRGISAVNDFLTPFSDGDEITNSINSRRQELQSELDTINRQGGVKKNEGFVDDVKSTFRSGVGSLKTGTAYLGKKAGLDTSALQGSGEVDQAVAQESFSDETKRIREEGVFGDQKGIADRAYAAVLGVTESTPGLLATIPITAAAVAALPEAAALAIGARAVPVLASRAPWLLRAIGVTAEQAATTQGAVIVGRQLVGTLAGTVTEGVQAAGSAGYETEGQIKRQIDANPEAFAQSELGRSLLEKTSGDLAKARDMAASDVAGNVALTTGFATSLLAIPGSAFESRIVSGLARKGFMKEAAFGAVGEGLQEAPQSGAEKLISNVGMQSVGSEVGTFEGVGRAAAEGAVVGGLLGGGVGTVGGALTPYERTPPPQGKDDELAAALDAERAVAGQPDRGGRTLESPNTLIDREVSALDEQMGTLRVGGLNLTPTQIMQSARANERDPRIANIMSQPVSPQTKVEQVARILNAEDASRLEPQVVQKITPLVGGTNKLSQTRAAIETELSKVDEAVIAESPILSAMAQAVAKDEKGKYAMGGKQAVDAVRGAVTGYRPTAPQGQTVFVRPERGGDGGVSMTQDQVAEERQREREAGQAFDLADRRQRRYESQTGVGGQREDLRPGASEPESQIFLDPKAYGEQLGWTPATLVASETPGMVRVQYESTSEMGADGAPVIISDEVSLNDLVGRVVRGSPRLTQEFARDQRRPQAGVGTGMAGPRNSIDRTSSKSLTTTPEPGPPMVRPVEPNFRYEGTRPNSGRGSQSAQPAAQQDTLPSPQQDAAPTPQDTLPAPQPKLEDNTDQQDGGEQYSGRASKRQKRVYGTQEKVAPAAKEAQPASLPAQGAAQPKQADNRATDARDADSATPDEARAAPKAEQVDYKAVIQDRLDKLAVRGRQGKVLANRIRSLMKDKNLTATQLYHAFQMGEVMSRVLPKNAGIDILFVPSLTATDATAAANSATRVGEEIPGKVQMYEISQNGFRGLITMSLSDSVLSVARENAAHEAFHVVQDMLFAYDRPAFDQINQSFFDGMRIDDLDASILRTLKTLSLNGQTSVYESLKSDFGNTPFGSSFEAQAVAFGALVDAKDRGSQMKGLKASFIRVVDMLANFRREFKNGLDKSGVQSVAEIFDGYRAGKAQENLTERAPLAGEGRASAEQYTARGVFPVPQRLFDKVGVPEEQRTRGGTYIDPKNREVFTGRTFGDATISINPETGSPSFVIDDATETEAMTPKDGTTVRTNLFKQKAGWKWVGDDRPAKTVVSVETRGKHFYTLATKFDTPVTLKSYPDAPSEPRLRPTTFGEITLGEQIGEIDVRGKLHPVYEGVTVHARGVQYSARTGKGKSQKPEYKHPEIGAQKIKVPLRGTSTIPFLYDNGKDKAEQTPGKSMALKDSVQFIQARTRTALMNRFGIDRIVGPNPDTDAYLSQTIASEAEAAILKERATGNRSALDWYTSAIENAIDEASAIYPMLTSDNAAMARNNQLGFRGKEDARVAFTLALSITSQNMKVRDNARATVEQFDVFLETGRFDPSRSYGTKAPSISGNLALANFMLEQVFDRNIANFGSFLNTEFTVSELNGIAKGIAKKGGMDKPPFSISGEQASEMVYGSAIFGPKIGNGFYQNLNRNFSPVTIDLWFMRLWGRLTGTLVGNDAAIAKQLQGLRDAIEADSHPTMKVPDGYVETVKNATEEEMVGVAVQMTAEWERQYKAFQKQGLTSKEITDQNLKPEWAYKAVAIAGQLKPNDAPTSGGQRKWIRDVVKTSVAMLAKNGYNVTPADLQALVWYPEKDLINLFKEGKLEANLNVSYDTAFKELAARRNANDQTADTNAGDGTGDGNARRSDGGRRADETLGQADQALAAGTVEEEGDKVRRTLPGQNRQRLIDRGAMYSGRTGSAEFKSWFRDSKVVDTDGNPRVVYHGTTSEISEFKPTNGVNGQIWGAGYYLTPDARYASSFAKDFTKPRADEDTGGNVMPLYASLQNPLQDAQEMTDIKREVGSNGAAITAEVKRRGYDGVDITIGGRPIVVAFEPAQIKSAVSNSGKFDPEDARIQYSGRTGSAEFNSWFGDSQVVDKNGDPLVVYHGSPNRGIEAFDTTRVTQRSARGDLAGAYFTSEPFSASNYARTTGSKERGKVYSTYLKIENPLDTTDAIRRYLRRGMSFNDAKQKALEALTPENDGVIFRGNGINTPEYVVFSPTQIKSATDNNGNFDPNDERIRYSARRGQRYTGGVSQSMMDKVVSNEPEPGVFGTFLDKMVGRRGGESRRRALVRNLVSDKDGMFMLDRMLDAAQRGVDISDGRVPVDGSSVGRAMEMASQSSGVVQAALEYGPPVFDGDLTTIHQDIPGLFDIFAPIGEEKADAFQTYAVARREKELRSGGRVGFTTLTDEEISETLSNADAEFKTVFDNYQAFNQVVLDYAVDTGLMTSELGDKLKSMDYIPYYRALELDSGELDVLGPNMGEALNNPKSALDLRLKGGDTGLGNLYENLIRNTQSILSAARKNLALQEAADAIDALNTAGVTGLGFKVREPKGEGVMRLRVDGKPAYYKIEDLAVWTAIASLGPQSRNMFVEVGSKLAGVLRSGITLSPSFMLRNLYRGKISAFVTTDAKLGIGIDSFKGAKDAFQGGEATRIIKVNSGMGGYTYGMGERDFANEIRRRYRRDEGGGYGFIRDWGDRFKGVLVGLEKIGEASEFAERVKLYKDLVAKGVTEKSAAYEAMNLTNFGRKGAGEGYIGYVASGLVPMIPFLNARIQGLYRIAENQQNEPTIMGLRQQVMIRGLLLTAASTLLYALAADDDRWDEESTENKMLNDIIYVGDKTIRLPRAFEVGTLFASMPIAFMDYVRDNDGQELGRKVRFAFMSTFALNPVPQMFLPGIGAAANLNWFTQRPIDNMADQNLPEAMRFDGNTSEIAKGIGKLADVSPKRVDYVIEGYMGTMAGYFTAAVDTILAGVGTIPKKPGGVFGDPYRIADTLGEVSGVTSFVRDSDRNTSRFVRDFYEMKREADQAARAYKVLREKGDTETAQELLEQNRAPIAARTQLGRLSKQMTDINKQIARVETDAKATPSEKTLKLKSLMKRRKAIARSGYEYARGIKIASTYDDEADTEE